MTQASLMLSPREEQKMKRKLSKAAEKKMDQAAPYETPSELAAPAASQRKENIFVQSLQEAGLGDLAQTETPMEQDDGQSSPEGEKSASESTDSDESDDVKDKWENEMERCLKQVLNKSDTQKAMRILKQLDQIEEFTLTNESVLFFKKKKLGNIYVLFHKFFGGEKKDAELFKQLEQFRRVLQANNIKVTQRKPYAKKAPAKKKAAATAADADDAAAGKKKEAPAVNQELLDRLKK
jgi:hypothetical protein